MIVFRDWTEPLNFSNTEEFQSLAAQVVKEIIGPAEENSSNFSTVTQDLSTVCHTVLSIFCFRRDYLRMI